MTERRLLFAFLFLLFGMAAGCGRDLSGVQRSFFGEKRCTSEASFDCECIQMNSPEHQKATGVAILKCPIHENYEAAIGHEYCLNRDPATGNFRYTLSLDACPWKETVEEKKRLLQSGK